LPTEELQGLKLFYHARIPDISPEGYISCASCHAGGGHDGMVWDVTHLGEGLRNTVSLNGASGVRFGNLHWSSNFDEVQDFELQLEQLNGGVGLIPGITFSGTDNPLSVTTSGESEELDALAAYVNGLGKDKVMRSPYRTYTGDLTPAAQRGLALFAADNCGDCHSTSAYRDGANHDVGTIIASSGSHLGTPLTGIRTPSLIQLWDSAPYFHNGSAATLNDVLDVGAHARSFTGTEKADLIEYLHSIDRELYIEDSAALNP
jgi:cytochrome c peroxidase